MSFRIITQSLVALIVITTLMITVCDSLPMYCQCIESNGSQFNAFVEYFILEYQKRTEFWLYQNRHKCQMFITNDTEIVIDTSGEIQTLDDNYRLWLGFYNVVDYHSHVLVDAYECWTYPKSQSEYEMECRKRKDIRYKFGIDEHKYSNALVVLKDFDARPAIDIIFLFQSESDGNWTRNEKRIPFHVSNYERGKRFDIQRQRETDSTDLSVLLKDIGSNVYINAVLNAFDAKHNTKGFFIFVTNNGIPMYCYKSDLQDRSDSCKIENMRQFMRECFPTTERPMNMTTISSQTSETNKNRTKSDKNNSKTLKSSPKMNSK